MSELEQAFNIPRPSSNHVISQAYDASEEAFARKFGSLSRDEITDELIQDYDQDLPLLTDEWLVYFTPAFIRVASDRNGSADARITILHRYVPSYSYVDPDLPVEVSESYLTKAFSPPQKRVIAKWLESIMDDEMFEFERKDIEMAIDRIWRA